jgi:hypothetical protein
MLRVGQDVGKGAEPAGTGARIGDNASTGLRTPRPPGEHVCVAHRRPHVGVAEELLHRRAVVAVLRQGYGEGVAQCVTRGPRRETGGEDGGAHGPADGGLAKAVPVALARVGIQVAAGGREDPRPARRRMLALQRARESHAAATRGEIALVAELV